MSLVLQALKPARALRMVFAALALTMVAGCPWDPDPEPDPTTTSAGPTIQTPIESSAPVLLEPSSLCKNRDYAFLVPMKPENKAESELLDSLTVCTDGETLEASTGTWIDNSADLAVWSVTAPPGVVAAIAPEGFVRVAAFRQAVAQVKRPAPRTIEPGVNSILAEVPPAQLQLSLDPQVQAAWSTTQLLADLIGPERKEVDRYLEQSRTRTSAMISCAIQGAHAGEELAKADADSQRIAAALSFASAASECRQKVEAAHAEDARLRPGEQPRMTVARAVEETDARRWTSITDDLIRVLRKGLVLLHK